MNVVIVSMYAADEYDDCADMCNTMPVYPYMRIYIYVCVCDMKCQCVCVPLQGDLDVIGAGDIRYAGIGGVSSLLGWTEVQQEEKKGLGGGVENVLKIIAGLVAVDACVLLWEQATYLAENAGV